MDERGITINTFYSMDLTWPKSGHNYSNAEEPIFGQVDRIAVYALANVSHVSCVLHMKYKCGVLGDLL